MDPQIWINGLLNYLGLIILLTFHEFGHAWMAWRCGDNTAHSQGRVSLNPLVHIDPIGTVIIPLLTLVLAVSGSGAGQFLIGWAKPVPVNPNNLRNPRGDDILVTLAGPWMNLLLAVILMGLCKLGMLLHADGMATLCLQMAKLSLFLCFFNLLPIPPLDGSHIVRVVMGISYQAYYQMARYGFLVLILVWQIRPVQNVIVGLTQGTLFHLRDWFGIPV